MMLSAIVCTRNRGVWLRWCLVSLCSQTVVPDEIIVVDGSDPSHTAGNVDLIETFSGLPIIRHVRASAGLTHQRNIGVRESTGSILLFLDDDVILHPSYVGHVKELIERDPAVVGVGGRIWNESHRSVLARSVRRLFTMADNKRTAMTLSGDAGHLFELDGSSDVAALSGSNMAFSRTLFAQHGLSFDEALEGYSLMEDLLFCLQAGIHGRLVQSGDALLFHGFRAKDRWSFAFARDYICHGAYVFASAGRPRGGRIPAFLWRTFGRFLYGVVNGIARGRWDTVRGSLVGLSVVLSNISGLRHDPKRFLARGSVRLEGGNQPVSGRGNIDDLSRRSSHKDPPSNPSEEGGPS